MIILKSHVSNNLFLKDPFMCYETPRSTISTTSSKKHEKHVEKEPTFYRRNLMKTRDGSVVAMATDSTSSETKAVVISSATKNFPAGSTVTYSSKMLHLLHCKDEKRKGHDDNCYLHGLDVVASLDESLTDNAFSLIAKNSASISIHAERMKGKDGYQVVKVYNKPAKKTRKFVLALDLKKVY